MEVRTVASENPWPKIIGIGKLPVHVYSDIDTCQTALKFDPGSACKVDPIGGSSAQSVGGTGAS